LLLANIKIAVLRKARVALSLVTFVMLRMESGYPIKFRAFLHRDFGVFLQCNLLLCFSGYGILTVAWLFTLKSIRYLILRKGGDKVTFVTYTPFGKNRMMTVDLNKVSMLILNQILDYLIKLQITFIPPCSPKSPVNYTNELSDIVVLLVYRCSEGMYCFYLHGQKVNKAATMQLQC
jgi:hypothetical protein